MITRLEEVGAGLKVFEYVCDEDVLIKINSPI